MEKSEVFISLQKINQKLSELNTNEIFLYITKDEYLKNHGSIKDVETILELVHFEVAVKKFFVSKTELMAKAIEELSLTAEERTELDKPIYLMGFTLNHWIQDINTKLQEIRYFSAKRKLEKTKIILENYLSDDEKFKLDTVGIEDVLNLC